MNSILMNVRCGNPRTLFVEPVLDTDFADHTEKHCRMFRLRGIRGIRVPCI